MMTIIISLRVHGQNNAGDGRGPLRVPPENDNNRTRRVPPRSNVRRAISLRATAANRSFSYTNPERSRNHLSELLYYYYYYHYARIHVEARAVRLEAILRYYYNNI